MARAKQKDDRSPSRESSIGFDRVLEEVGSFGKFQYGLIIQCLLASTFMAFAVNEFVFTTTRINTRCLISECESVPSEFTPPWLSHAVPDDGDTSDSCQRFGNSSWISNVNDSSCPAALFDNSAIVPCEEYVYEHHNTVAYDFDLACEDWYRALIGSVRVFGIMLSIFLTGNISDRWGRKSALVFNCVGAASFGVARYWTTSYVSYVSVMFLESLAGGGILSSSYVLVLESVGAQHRVAAGASINLLFAVGQIILAAVSLALPHWRSLILALYIPQFITVIYIWTMSESARWVFSKGRYEEGKMLLKKMAQKNHRQISEEMLDALIEHYERDKLQKAKEKQPLLVVTVFRHKDLLLRSVVTCFWWVTFQIVYYGLSYSAVTLAGSLQVNFMLLSVAELPGYCLAVLLVNRVGRKPVFIGAMWLCALALVAFLFTPDSLYSLSLLMYMVGKLSIATACPCINIYTLELFPTVCRHRLFAFSVMTGRVGSVLAPLLPTVAAATFKSLPFVLFAGMAVTAALTALLMPETLGTKLPDTLEETVS